MAREWTAEHSDRSTTSSAPAGPPRLARRVLLGLVHGNVWISIGAASLAVSSMKLAGLPLDPLPVLLVFGATMVVYGVNRFTDLSVDAHNVPSRAAFTRRYGAFLFIGGLTWYLATMGVAVATGVPWAEYLWLPPLVGGLYSTRTVQQWLVAKNVLVGLGWACVPIGVGIYYDAIWIPEILVVALVTAVVLTVAAMVFDVKDIPGDRAAGVRTVATECGPAWVHRIAVATCLVVAVAVLGALEVGFLPARFLALLVFPGYVAGYSRFATTDRSPLFYGFVVDGEHLFLALVVLATT